MSIQPAKATSRHRSEVEQTPSGPSAVFDPMCYSGQLLPWRIHLMQRFYLQEVPGATFEPAWKNVGVTADWPMSWRSWGNRDPHREA